MIHRMNLAALFFYGCSIADRLYKQRKTDFSKYITGYTSGVIKSSSSLSVYLGQPSDKGFQAGSTLPGRFIQDISGYKRGIDSKKITIV